MLDGLDLFSGIGGLTEAFRRHVVPVAYCESDGYDQAQLLSRMYFGEVPLAPIWDDVRSLPTQELPRVDIVYGGFPCQDISAAGRGAGLEGERSGLYWELHRIVRETKPSLVFLENVPAIRTRGLDTVVRSLADVGYDCRWTVVSAAEVGAPHLRQRWFLLAADADSDQLWKQPGRGCWESRKETSLARFYGEKRTVADAEGERRIEGRSELRLRRRPSADACSGRTMGDADGEGQLQRIGREGGRRNRDTGTSMGDARSARSQGPSLTKKTWRALAEHRYASKRDWPSWLPEPTLPRGHHGLSFRVDRTRGLGNAVVPEQAETAYERLMGYTE